MKTLLVFAALLALSGCSALFWENPMEVMAARIDPQMRAEEKVHEQCDGIEDQTERDNCAYLNSKERVLSWLW